MTNYHVTEFQPGQSIFLEGKHEKRFFIFVDGQVDVSKNIETPDDDSETSIKKGDMVGVIAALCEQPQLLSVTALSKVHLIFITNDQFETIVRENPSIAFTILQGFSQRQRILNDGLASLLGKGTNEEKPDFASILYNTGMYYESHNNMGAAWYCYDKYMESFPSGPAAEDCRLRVLSFKEGNSKPAYEQNGLVRKYKKDSMIFAEGEAGDMLYIVTEGTVKIGKVAGDKELIFAVDKPGDIFGEMALLDNAPRSAAAIANEDCTLTAVNKQGFQELTKAQPAVIKRITQTLAERLWYMDKQFANLHIKDPAGRMFDAIVMHFEKDRADEDESYTFKFGLTELSKMIGLEGEQIEIARNKVLENKFLTEKEGKLTVKDIVEIRKERDYYLSVQRRTDKKKPARINT
ncbi:MAG: cyclic nucleotide-binding domain-containing protein [Spirochaetaceae bacterium]|jgi:CRP-like cAMP-binding protein|nr:cyclic nucleotide-binding domain-containing protein [Spirochaetaceae bacterium]